MLSDQTITVSGVERTYTPGWDAEFAKDIADNSASIRKAPLTGGNSILKYAHSEQKSVERHQMFLRDKTASDGVTNQEQAYIVLTCKADDPASALRAIALGAALCTHATASSNAILTQMVAGQM